MADSPEAERELDGEAASKAVSEAFEKARANLRQSAAQVTAELGPGNYFIRIPGKAPCPSCGVPEGVQLRVSTGGYSCGSGFQHKPECPALRCRHGVLWHEDCATCEADRGDEDGEE